MFVKKVKNIRLFLSNKDYNVIKSSREESHTLEIILNLYCRVGGRGVEKFLGWRHICYGYFFWLMRYKQRNTKGRCAWTAKRTILKNKRHLVTWVYWSVFELFSQHF